MTERTQELLTIESPQAVAVSQSNATTLLQAIERAASNPETDMDKMERLFDMHQKMLKQEAEAEFNAALARAQLHIEPVAHNATNDQTRSRYAKLAAINRAIAPIYTAEGFSVSFDTADSPKDGYLRVLATLSHARGHSRVYHMDLPPDEAGAKGNVNKTKVHATGSTNSYARRYLVCMIFNVTTEDDNDGNANEKVMPDNQRDGFLEEIEELSGMPAADELWKRIADACQKIGDIASYEVLKSSMAKRRKAIAAQGKEGQP